MRSQLTIHWPSPHELWSIAPRDDSLVAELVDGQNGKPPHYSRQTPGAHGFLAPGRSLVLHHNGPRGAAAWGVVYNMDSTGAMRWRNSIFRNESGTLSSSLIAAATSVTYVVWVDKYGALPEQPLRTEVQVAATAARRSRNHEPGHCYLMAGWRKVRDIPSGHGRPAKVELEAPMMDTRNA